MIIQINKLILLVNLTSNNASTVYVIYKTYATITLNYSQDGIKVYKNY